MTYPLPVICRSWLDQEHAGHSIAKHGHGQQYDFLRGDYWANDNFGGLALSYFTRRKFFMENDPETSARRAQLSGKMTSTLDALYAGIVSLDGSDIPSAFSVATRSVEQHLSVRERAEHQPELDDDLLWNKLTAQMNLLERLVDAGDIPHRYTSLLSLGGTVLEQGAILMHRDFGTCLSIPGGFLPKPSLTSGNIEPWDITQIS